MRSHFSLGPGLAMACAAVGASSIPAGVCSAQVVLASDSATDPAYADGWQAGDNGGTGLGAWNFTGTYNTPVGQSMDGTSIHNQLGLAWTLYNAEGPAFGNSNPPEGTDISQAGRGIPTLLPGHTVSVVIDNPTERRFFRGYTVRFNTGGGNTVFEGVPRSRMAVGTFEYGTNGKWYASGSGGDPNLFDTDTDAGMRIDFTLTGEDTFNLVMTPLDNPTLAFTKSGTLEGGGPIDWIEFELYNTDSDFFPTPAATGQGATDFYIRSIEVTGIPEPSAAAIVGALAAAGLAMRRRRDT
jgi:hypothetical protein